MSDTTPYEPEFIEGDDLFEEGYEGDLGERLEEIEDDVAEQRAEVLRRALDEYDLDDDDLEVLEGDFADDGTFLMPALPVLAVVGRPNVGKSALVNRILGRREAVVEDVPGVTRDRVSYRAEWGGRHFTLVDTGGWEPDARGIDRSVAEQAEIAIELADAVLFVVDSNVGPTSSDEHVVKMLRKSDRPVLLLANKVDDLVQEPNAATLWGLGLGEPWPVSALHGRGVADMLDEAMRILPEVSKVAKQEVGGPRRVAIVGRPNVGKSSLLNKAAGRSASSSTTSPAPPVTPSTRSSRSAVGSGASSTPRVSASACTYNRAPTSTPRCAPRRRLTRPKWQSSCST